jgi:tetratricopeptide (TPR) repeat protein
MNKLGEIAQYRDEPARAVHIYEESLALFEELGNREGIGLVLHNLGYEALQAGDLERATALHTKSLGHFCEAGIQWGIGVAQGLLGVVAGVQGNHRLANEWLQQSLAIWQNLKNKHGIARTLNRLGEVKINEGAYGDALALHQQGLVLAQEIDNRAEIAISLQGVAATITVEEQAACLLGAAEVLRETLGLTLRPVERTYWKRIVTDVRAQLDDAAFFAAWFEGRAMTTTQAIAQALCVSRHFDERKCADLQFV